MAISTTHTLASSAIDEPVSVATGLPMTHDELIQALDMKEDLCVHSSLSEKGILHAFAKYQEINKAYTRLRNKKSWPGKKLLCLTIIKLCMSKSQFYDDFHPLFTEAGKYPDMMEWLMQKEDCLSGYDLFGEEKAFYTKPDVECWIERKKEKKKKKEKKAEKKGEFFKRSHKKQ